MQFPQVSTTPKPWGIQVKWQWPEGSEQYSHLEIQYLYSGGDLKKKILGWPCESMTIGGLKAGERLQIRLRPISKDGAVIDWTGSDWIEGVASSDAEEYLDVIAGSSYMRLMTTFHSPTFNIENGQVFINDAFISGVEKNIEAILKNALSENVRKVIQKECLPGGLIWHQRGR